MATTRGRQVRIAFEAVLHCHEGVARLIADVDKFMTNDKWSRIGRQNSVTGDNSRLATASSWMAKQVHRRFCNPIVGLNIVDGINLRFFAEHAELAEPRLYVGRCRYIVPAGRTLESVAKWWDFDEGWGKWCNGLEADLGKAIACDTPEERIARISVVAVDLYSIDSIEHVRRYLEAARAEFGTVEQ